MPFDERRIDGHKADPAAHAQRREEIGLAQADDGDIDRAANFQEAGLLEMTDDEASYPARSASSAWRIVCAAQRNSVSG